MITVTIDDGGLELNLSKARLVSSLQLQKWMTRTVARVQSAIVKNIGRDGLIGRRTGNLARSIMTRVTVTQGDSFTITGDIWPDLGKAIYAGVQEFGGQILPSKATHLTVPLTAMLTGNGVPRASASEVRANPSGWGFVATFIPKNHDVIMGKTQGGDIVPLFALKTQVIIPAHHYIEQTWQQQLPEIMADLEAMTGETVRMVTEGQ